MENKERVCACITLRDYDVIVLDNETTITVWRHRGRSRLFIDAPDGSTIQRLKREDMPPRFDEET